MSVPAQMTLQGWQVADVYTSVDAEIAAARQGCGLVDESANGKVLVEGLQAEKVVAGEQAYRLRPDLYFISTPPLGVKAVCDRLRAKRGGDFITVTDVTHGRAEFRFIGPAATEVLSTVCGLNFADFPDGAAKQSSLAKTPQLIIRRDGGGLPAFSIIGARSLGAYLWDVLQRSGATPVGAAAVNTLNVKGGQR